MVCGIEASPAQAIMRTATASATLTARRFRRLTSGEFDSTALGARGGHNALRIRSCDCFEQRAPSGCEALRRGYAFSNPNAHRRIAARR